MAATMKSAVLSTANTNRDGTGTLVDVVTAPANGCIIEEVTMAATSNTNAGMLRVFIFDGTNTRLEREVTVEAITPSGSVRAFQKSFRPTGLKLTSGQKLQMSTHLAETFHVVATVIEL
jgi:hypothetical protein